MTVARSVEARLLLACAGGPRATTAAEEMACDWPLVEALAARHSLAPLLYRLANRDGVAMPKATYAALWARAAAIESRSRAMTDEMLRLARLVEGAGLRALPYKGPSLARAAFGAVGAREFGDLDFLVPPAEVFAIRELLAREGYRPEFELPPHLEQALLASHRHYEYPLHSRERGFLVELHWRADPEVALLPLDSADWWAGLPAVDFDGQSVRTLPLPQLVAVLALHGTKHAWSALSWLADLGALLPRCGEHDWRALLDDARRLQCERRIALGLRLARDLLGVALPREAGALADDRVVARNARVIEAGWFTPEFTAPRPLQWMRFHLGLHQRAAGWMGSGARWLFEPGLGEWTRWRIPAPLRFLYYPLRLARLIGKYGAGERRA